MSEVRVPVRPVTKVTSSDVLKRLKAGVDVLANAVGSTLGAAGRTVIIEDGGGNPHPTKDGVTVAQHIYLKDPVQNMGALVVRQSAMKTAKEAGDGTTSSTVLAQAIISGFTPSKDIRFADFRAGMREAVRQAHSILDSIKVRLLKADIPKVAAISTNNDEELGGIIAKAFNKAGRYGMVLQDESPSGVTYVETVEGMQLDRGLASPYFVNTDKDTCDLNNPLLFISTVKIDAITQIQTLLAKSVHENRPLVIVADMEQEVLKTLVLNKVQNGLKVAVITPPGFGWRLKETMEDLAVLAGCSVFSKETADNFELLQSRSERDNVKVQKSLKKFVGDKIESVSIGFGKTILMLDPEDDKVRVVEHRQVLEAKRKNPDVEDVEKDWLKERIANIAGAVSIVRVGAKTDAEGKEKKDRVEDAIAAVEAALEQGVVAGGGVPLRDIAADIVLPAGSSSSFMAGFELVRAAMGAPYYKILDNAGIDPQVVEMIKDEQRYRAGVDVNSMQSVDMIDAGIIDPVKVVKSSLENAVSASYNILSTENVITFTGLEDESGV